MKGGIKSIEKYLSKKQRVLKNKTKEN